MQFHSSDSVCFVRFSKWPCGLSPPTLPPSAQWWVSKLTRAGVAELGAPQLSLPQPAPGSGAGSRASSVSSPSPLCISRDCIAELFYMSHLDSLAKSPSFLNCCSSSAWSSALLTPILTSLTFVFSHEACLTSSSAVELQSKGMEELLLIPFYCIFMFP